MNDEPNRMKLQSNGKPTNMQPEYRALLPLWQTYPRQTAVLNIYGDKDDGSHSDGSVSNASSQSLRYLVAGRAKSYQERKIVWANAQHSKLHDNVQVNRVLIKFAGVLFWVNMSTWLNLTIVLLISGNLGFLCWYLSARLGVKSFKGLYFVDDERDREIALRVHNVCLNTFITGICLLMLLVFILMDSGWQLTVSRFGNIILCYLLLMMFGSNCQYYYLWRKYDRA